MGLTLIASAEPDASTPAVITFTDGTDGVVFDNTYNEYQFYCVNIHPETDNTGLQWQVNAASGDNQAGFDQVITSTAVRAYHPEDGSDQGVGYQTSEDQAQEAGYEWVSENVGNQNNECLCAILTIYDPSSAYIKHFTVEANTHMSGDGSKHGLRSGYINEPDPIDEINFKMSSGSIQSGTIYMYGVS